MLFVKSNRIAGLFYRLHIEWPLKRSEKRHINKRVIIGVGLYFHEFLLWYLGGGEAAIDNLFVILFRVMFIEIIIKND